MNVHHTIKVYARPGYSLVYTIEHMSRQALVNDVSHCLTLKYVEQSHLFMTLILKMMKKSAVWIKQKIIFGSSSSLSFLTFEQPVALAPLRFWG